MGFYIPIFFVEINCSDLPKNIDSWEDIREILEEIYTSNGDYGYFSVARNFWHAYAFSEISSGLGSKDLSFILDDFVCLNNSELLTSLSAIDYVLSEISKGLPKVYSGECYLGDSSWICEDISSEEIAQAYSLSMAKRAINAGYSRGIDQLIDLFSFAKSLKEAISSAIDNNNELLYAKPPP